MNTGQAIDFYGPCSWIPGSRAKPAPRNDELGFVYSTLVRTADNMQIYKYVAHNVAHQYGKTAIVMPKPVKGDNGSGMHVHQSLWKGQRPTFAGLPLALSSLSPERSGRSLQPQR